MVDTRDLKSLARKSVRVRAPPRASVYFFRIFGGRCELWHGQPIVGLVPHAIWIMVQALLFEQQPLPIPVVSPHTARRRHPSSSVRAERSLLFKHLRYLGLGTTFGMVRVPFGSRSPRWASSCAVAGSAWRRRASATPCTGLLQAAPQREREKAHQDMRLHAVLFLVKYWPQSQVWPCEIGKPWVALAEITCPLDPQSAHIGLFPLRCGSWRGRFLRHDAGQLGRGSAGRRRFAAQQRGQLVPAVAQSGGLGFVQLAQRSDDTLPWTPRGTHRLAEMRVAVSVPRYFLFFRRRNIAGSIPEIAPSNNGLFGTTGPSARRPALSRHPDAGGSPLKFFSRHRRTDELG